MSTRNPSDYISRKSKKTTWFLVRYFGIFGAHRFYAGRMISGFVYLCTLGLLFIGWSRDIRDVLNNRFKDEIGHIISDEREELEGYQDDEPDDDDA